MKGIVSIDLFFKIHLEEKKLSGSKKFWEVL